MGGVHQQCQRVKPGVLSLRAGAEVAEREVVAGVERIAEGPHLRQHDGCANRLYIVQHCADCLRERLRRREIDLLPFQIADPHSAVGRGGPGDGGWGGGRRRSGGRDSLLRQCKQRRKQKDGYYYK